MKTRSMAAAATTRILAWAWALSAAAQVREHARASVPGPVLTHAPPAMPWRQAAAFAPLAPLAPRAAPGALCRPSSPVSVACAATDGGVGGGGGKPVAQAVRSILTSPDSKAVRKAISTVCDFHERDKSDPPPHLLLAMLAACRATGDWRRAQTLLRKLKAPAGGAADEGAAAAAETGSGVREQGSSSLHNEGASIAIGACARWGPEEVRCRAQGYAPNAWNPSQPAASSLLCQLHCLSPWPMTISPHVSCGCRKPGRL